MSETEQAARLSDDGLEDFAIRFVLAMLRSADPEIIGPRNWWERARTALETSAACAESWSQMVSRCGVKLQVRQTTAGTSSEIKALGEALDDPAVFERFRYLSQRDALYIVAMARARRDEEKERHDGDHG